MPDEFAIPDSVVEKFQQDGVVCLRGVFDESWVDKIEKGIAKNQKAPSKYSENLRTKDGPGYYFNDYFNWRQIPEFEDYILNSATAGIAGRLMRSKYAAFYHEHVLTKDPGTFKTTPWHQDQPYYPVDGLKNLSIWMPVDHVSLETTIQFVRGSHRWGKWFVPRKFATSLNYPIEQSIFDRSYEDVPDIDSDVEKYEILEWELEPGDCVAFHMLTLHGAHSNTSRVPRRVISTRWLGDDMVLARRPWQVSPPIVPEGLQPGDSLVSELFPILWKAKDYK